MDTPYPVSRLNAALEGRYRIEREIGEGGMATVYLADDLKHERKVALKVLKPELAAVVGARLQVEFLRRSRPIRRSPSVRRSLPGTIASSIVPSSTLRSIGLVTVPTAP